MLPEGAFLEDRADLAKYEKGWRYGSGRALAVAKPSTVQEVAAVLSFCHEQQIRVIPQGANTGLVGASTPDTSGGMVVLSLERLDHRLDIDPTNRTVLADGGILLSHLNNALGEFNLMFPVDLGADPMVGAMVATNTGGTRLLKYGDVRHNLLGLEVVLADGTILDQLTCLRKNNTGLDAKHLFTATTGVFGVITAAVLQAVPVPKQRAVAMVGLVDGESALSLLGMLEGRAQEFLTAFEVISAGALRPVFQHQPRLRNPYGHSGLPPFSALVELSSSLPQECLNLSDLLETTLGDHLENDSGATDVFLGKHGALWEIRHHVSESLRSEGTVLGLDLSVPRSKLPEFREAVNLWVRDHYPFLRLCDFGHWGDGGIHLNLVWDEAAAPIPAEELIPEVQEQLYRMTVLDYHGSYSAEHGVGPHNQAFFDLYTPQPIKALGAVLKRHFDPEGILGTTRLW